MERPFRWKKKGLVFAPDGRYGWMQSHAQNPSVLVLEDRLRVYFTCRPAMDSGGNFTSLTTFVDLDRSDPSRIIYLHDSPVLRLGNLGAFDQFGVMPGCALRVGKQVWLYYVGWSRSLGVPYNHAIGLALSDDDGFVFRRVGQGPVLTRNPSEPFIQNSPFVLRRMDGFQAWYSSGVEWIKHESRMESIYVLMRGVSLDGINWVRDGARCIPSRVEKECQTNPCVVEDAGVFHMWFCYRHGLDFRTPSRGYRIGYAWSPDLTSWHRDDASGGLEPSPAGWDSEMVCYPCVVRVGDRTYMFYSGNHFGRDGFGYAILET